MLKDCRLFPIGSRGRPWVLRPESPTFYALLFLPLLGGCFSSLDAPTCKTLADCPIASTACHAGICIIPNTDTTTNPEEAKEDALFDGSSKDVSQTLSCAPETTNCLGWTADLGGAIAGTPAVFNGVLYVGSAGEAGAKVTAVDIATGEILWETNIPLEAPRCTLVDDQGRIAVADDHGACQLSATGEENWCWDTGDTLVGCPAATRGGSLYMGLRTDAGAGRASAIVDGNEVWSTELSAAPVVSPTHLKTLLAYALSNQTIELLLPWDGLVDRSISTTGTVIGELPGDAWSLWMVTQKEENALLSRIVINSQTGEEEEAHIDLPFSPGGTVLVLSPESVLVPALDGNLYALSLPLGATAPPVEAPFLYLGGTLSSPVLGSDDTILVLDEQASTLRSFTSEGGLQWSSAINTYGGLGEAKISAWGSWVLISTAYGHLHGWHVPALDGLSQTALWPKERKNEQNLGGF